MHSIRLSTQRRPRRVQTSGLFAAVFAILAILVHGAPVHAQGCVPLPPYGTDADRIGMNVVVEGGKGVFDYDTDYFGAGWFLDYLPDAYSATGSSVANTDVRLGEPALPSGVQGPSEVSLPIVYWGQRNPHAMGYVHTLRTTDVVGNWHTVVDRLISSYPGMLLIVGNEPDRAEYQDDEIPSEYARIYHDVYEYVKQRDPTVTIAIAGVVQPTPLRLRYLDMVLDAYMQSYGAKMPIDVWTVHAFILREVSLRDFPDNPDEVWGAGIPPGVTDYKADQQIFDVKDHGDIEILKQFIRDFRLWMQQRGYRDTPLLVTEYGILMPPDYDAGNERTYDTPFVAQFLRETTEFFFTARDAATGYPADNNRLVQAWSWYALNNVVNGYLVQHDSGAVTPLGEDFAAMTAKYGASTMYTDLAVQSISTSRTSLPSSQTEEQITVSFSVQNRGNKAADGAVVRFWLGDPGNGGRLLKTITIGSKIRVRCQKLYEGESTITLPALATGAHTLSVTVSGTGVSDPFTANNTMTLELVANTSTGVGDTD